MLRLNDMKSKIEIVLTIAMMMIGGSLVQAQTPHDTSYTASFPCSGYDGCPSSGTVKLKFTPKPGAHAIRWQSILTSNKPGATRIGTLTNVDAMRFPSLDLASGAVAGMFIGQIGPDSVNDRGFGIYKLDSQGHRVGQPWWKKSASEITYCEPPTPTMYPGGRSQAAIHMKDTAHEMGWNCGPIVPAAANAQSSSSNSHSMSLVSMPRKSQGISHLWISCSGGCCDIGAM